jgi:hypothetical protein
MPQSQHLIIKGESAILECLGSDAFTSWNTPSSLRINDHIEEFAPVDPYRSMIENFSDHIAGETSWILPLSQSLFVAKLLDQIKAFES